MRVLPGSQPGFFSKANTAQLMQQRPRQKNRETASTKAPTSMVWQAEKGYRITDLRFLYPALSTS
jgi:hypothetical protein